MTLLAAAINFLNVLNISPTMASQGGRVHIDQSDIHLGWNPDKMAKGGFLTATPEGMQHLKKNFTPNSERRTSGELNWQDIER